MTQTQSYKPRYSIALYVGYVLAMVIAIFLLDMVIEKGLDAGINTFLITISILTILLVVPFMLIKRIIFTPTNFVVERYVLPKREFSYEAVVAISNQSIKTQEGSVLLHFIANAEDLIELFDQAKKSGMTDAATIEPDLLRSDNVGLQIFLLANFLSLPLSILLPTMLPAAQAVDFVWIYLLLLCFSIPLFYLILKYWSA